MSTKTVAAEVIAERARQDAKWGEQNHPDGTGPARYSVPAYNDVGHSPLITMSGADVAEVATENTNLAAREGRVTWSHILFEEVAEAFAEDDPAKLRTELIQVAAVAQQWVEAIDRRFE